MQGDNRPSAFIGFQEEAVVGVVVEEILRQGGTTEGILQDVEVAFPVRISIGVVLPELVPGKPERSGAVTMVFDSCSRDFTCFICISRRHCRESIYWGNWPLSGMRPLLFNRTTAPTGM